MPVFECKFEMAEQEKWNKKITPSGFEKSLSSSKKEVLIDFFFFLKSVVQ